MVLEGKNAAGDTVAVEAVYFGDTEGAYEELRDRTSVSVLYQPGVNEYNGRRSIQLVIRDYIWAVERIGKASGGGDLYHLMRGR